MSKVVSGCRPGVSRETPSSQPPSRPDPSVLRATVDNVHLDRLICYKKPFACTIKHVNKQDIQYLKNTAEYCLYGTYGLEAHAFDKQELSVISSTIRSLTYAISTYSIDILVFEQIIIIKSMR